MKYILVIYKYDDKDYCKQIGKPVKNKYKLIKPMLGLYKQLSIEFYSRIVETEEK